MFFLSHYYVMYDLKLRGIAVILTRNKFFLINLELDLVENDCFLKYFLLKNILK